MNGPQRPCLAKLAWLKFKYPAWTFAPEGCVWTATARPTPAAVWFAYGRDLDELEAKIAKSTSPPGI